MDEQFDYSDVSSEQLDADVIQPNIEPQDNDIDEPAKSKEKIQLYNNCLNRISSVTEALNQTASKYSKDSDEYRALLITCNTMTRFYYEITSNKGAALDEMNKTNYEAFARDVNELNDAADKYICHCYSQPKSGSRRRTRFTLASMLSNICKSFICGKTLETYLQDNIAEEFYNNIVEKNISKLKAEGLSEDDIKFSRATFKKEKETVIKKIKEDSSFKAVIESANLERLIELKENPEIAFKTIYSAMQKSAADNLKTQKNEQAAKSHKNNAVSSSPLKR